MISVIIVVIIINCDHYLFVCRQRQCGGRAVAGRGGSGRYVDDDGSRRAAAAEWRTQAFPGLHERAPASFGEPGVRPQTRGICRQSCEPVHGKVTRDDACT